jgi:hypothetical protein
MPRAHCLRGEKMPGFDIGGCTATIEEDGWGEEVEKSFISGGGENRQTRQTASEASQAEQEIHHAESWG